MKRRKEIYQVFQIVNASFIAILFLCVTLCISFTYSSLSEKSPEQTFLIKDLESKNAELPQNPFSGSSEEKTENTVNSLSEFLPEIFSLSDDFNLCRELRNRTVDIYMAFHSELILPPPKG